MQRPLTPFEARRLNVNWMYSVGIKLRGQAGREYMTMNGQRGSHRLVVKIRKAYNLGNHIRQVSNAIRFAEIHNLKDVQLPDSSHFEPGEVGGVNLLSSTASITRPLLEGTFFYHSSFGIPPMDLDRARILRALAPRFPLSGDAPSIDFVAHLRAGDVFEPNPHPRYGPPPLSFYIESISLSGAREIVLVTQSMSHPYISPIVAWAKQQDIVVTVECSDLLSDFSTMRRARNVCVSQGTLALAAVWLSPYCDAVYAYQREEGEYQTLKELGMQVHRSTGEDFPISWSGSEEQLEALMDLRRAVRWD